MQIICSRLKTCLPTLTPQFRCFSATNSAAISAPSENQAFIKNCLEHGFGFSPPQISTLEQKLPTIFASSSNEIQIPQIWATMQRYGLSDLKKFRTLCLSEPRICELRISHIEKLLDTLKEFGMLEEPGKLFDCFTEYPKLLLKKAEKTERLLKVMFKLIGCDKKYIGELVGSVPVVLFTSVKSEFMQK